MVEGWIGQRQCDARHAELRSDYLAGLHLRAEPAAHPEHATVRVPKAITGAFERDARRQGGDLIDQTTPAQDIERRRKDRLLALALRVAEACEQCLAVEHHSGVCGEDVLRLEQFDPGAAGAERIEQALPLLHGGGVQHVAALVPGGRIHPGMIL